MNTSLLYATVTLNTCSLQIQWALQTGRLRGKLRHLVTKPEERNGMDDNVNQPSYVSTTPNQILMNNLNEVDTFEYIGSSVTTNSIRIK